MIFVHTISTPANTAQAAPQETLLELGLGIIHRVDVGFPPGSAGLLHVAIDRDGRQLYPSNPQGNWAWDGLTQQFPTWFPLESEPFSLTARTWNDDDSFLHQVTLQILILPREILLPPREETGVIQRLSRIVGGRA